MLIQQQQQHNYIRQSCCRSSFSRKEGKSGLRQNALLAYSISSSMFKRQQQNAVALMTREIVSIVCAGAVVLSQAFFVGR